MDSAVAKLKATAVSLKSDLEELPSFAKFDKAVSEFWTAYLEGWRGSERGRRLFETPDTADSELEFSRDCHLLKDSPLETEFWQAVMRAAEEVAQAVGPDERQCYSMSLLLNAEIYPTITGGERLRDPDHELEYLTGEFASKMRAGLKKLVELFPFLGECRLDLTDCSEYTLFTRVVDLSHRVRESLRDPGNLPGFLDLVLDRSKGCVSRRGKPATLASSSTRWPVLIKLVRNREDVTGSESVVKLLQGSGAVTAGAANQAISELRKMLRPLGVGVKIERKLGWRLVELKDLPQRRRQKRR